MSQKRNLVPIIVDLVVAGIVLSFTLMKGYLLWHWLVSVCIFVLFHIISRIILSPRVRMLSKLSFRDTRKRKTSSALLFCGLMLASSVVSSSLIVGDSFDATLEDRLVSSLGETDWIVEGIDPLTSSPLLMNQTRVMAALDDLMTYDEIDGIGIELHQPVTGITVDGSKVNPNVVWLAPDVNLRNSGPWVEPLGVPPVSWSQLGGSSQDGIDYAIVNQALANSLSLMAGSQFSISWSQITDNESIRKSHDFIVQSVIDPTGLGWENANQPLLLTDLKKAQVIQNKVDFVSRAVVSGAGDVFEGYIIPNIETKIENSFSEAMIASDAGFHWDGMFPGGIATLTRTSGGGLLTSGDVSGINSALQIVQHDSDASSFLLTPISGIWENEEKITSINGKRILAVDLDSFHKVIVTDSAVYISNLNDDPVHLFFDYILDVEIINSTVYVLTEREIISVDIESNTPEIIALNSNQLSDISVVGSTIWGVSNQFGGVYFHTLAQLSNEAEFSKIDYGISNDILGSKIYFDGFSIVTHFETIFDSNVCWTSENESSCTTSGNSKSIFLHRNQTFTKSENSIRLWNGSDFELVHVVNSSILGANSNGLIIEGHDSILVWASNLFSFVEGRSIPSTVNGFAYDESNGSILASTDYGIVMIDQFGHTSIELFNSFDVGLGIELPPFLISLEGDVVNDLLGSNQTVRFRDGIADFNQIETFSIGKNIDDDFRLEIEVDTSSVSLDDFIALNPDIGLLDSAIIGTISMDIATELLGGNPKRSMILVQMPENESDSLIVKDALQDWADRRANIQSSSSSLVSVKEDAVLSIDGAGSSFSVLFLIFGVFIVIAGLLLIVNLWIMSADDRSKEWGLLRSIGASSQDIEWILRIEGVMLSTPACFLGSFLGMFLAGLLMGGLGVFFQATFGVGFSFYWTFQSILVGACVGFIVSVVTLRISSFFLSRRNLITALRGLRVEKSALGFWGIIGSIFLAVVALVSSIMSFFLGDFSPGTGHSLWISGISLFVLSLVVPLSAIISRFVSSRSNFMGVSLSKNDAPGIWSCTIIGFTLILFSWIEDPIRVRYEVTDTSLIISGIFTLIGGVLILSTSGPIFIRQLLSLIGRLKPSISAIISLSIAYPQSRPFRSAVSMSMYSIVIFALIVLSGYSTMFGNYVSDIGKNSRGEFDILITGSGQELDISSLEAWSNDDLDRNGIESLAVMDIGLCIISGEDLNATYSSLRNIPQSFIESGALPLSQWDNSLGETPVEIWNAVISNPNLAIVDASIGMDSYTVLGALPLEGGGLSPGSSFEVRDPNRPLLQSNLRVAGVLTEDASLLLSGIFVSDSTFSSMIESSTNMVWIDVSNDVNIVDVSSNLQLELGSDGANVLVIDELFNQISLILVSLLGLLRVFLALGLFVGVTGLAVVTARSINERNQQIGVMRAIGMKRNQIVSSILLEVGWISGLGIINGLIAGIVFYRLLFDTYMRDFGTPFLIPWLEFFLIILFSVFMTLVSVLLPIRKSALISPASAMRYL